MTSTLPSMVDIVENHLQSPQLTPEEKVTFQNQRKSATSFTAKYPLANENVNVYSKQSTREKSPGKNPVPRPYNVTLEKWKELANVRKELNDEIMLCYLNDLANGTKSKTHDGKDWFWMKSYLLNDEHDWKKMGADGKVDVDMKNRVLHRYRDCQLSSFSTIIIPYNIRNYHWILIAANMDTDELTSYDGLKGVYHGDPNSPMQKCADLINSLLNFEGKEAKEFSFHSCSSCPVQTGGLDCCLIAALNAHAIIRGVIPIDFISGGMAQIKSLRLRLAYEMMKKADIRTSYETWLHNLQAGHRKEATNALEVLIKPVVSDDRNNPVFPGVMDKNMKAKVDKIETKVAIQLFTLARDIENVFYRVKAFPMVLRLYCQRRNAKDHYLLPWITTEYSIMEKSIMQLTNGQRMSSEDNFQSRVCRDVFRARLETNSLVEFWKSVLGNTNSRGIHVHKGLLKQNKVLVQFGDMIHDRLEELEIERRSIKDLLPQISITIRGIPTNEDVTGICSLHNRQYQYKDIGLPTILPLKKVHSLHQWFMFHLYSMNFVYVKAVEGPKVSNPAFHLIKDGRSRYVVEGSGDEVVEVKDTKKEVVASQASKSRKEKSNATSKKRKTIQVDEDEEDNDPHNGIIVVDSPDNKKGGDKKQASKKQASRIPSTPPVATVTNNTPKRSKRIKKAASTKEGNSQNGRTNDTFEAGGSESKEEDHGGGDEMAEKNNSELSREASPKIPCIIHFKQNWQYGSCAINAANAVVANSAVQEQLWFTKADADSASETVANTTGYQPETDKGNYELPALKKLLERTNLSLKQLCTEDDADVVSADTDNQAFIVLTQQSSHGCCHIHTILKVDQEVWDLNSTNSSPKKLRPDRVPALIEMSAKHDNTNLQAPDIQGAKYTVRNKDDHIIFQVMMKEDGSPFRPSWQDHHLPNSFRNLPILSKQEGGYNERRIWALDTLESESEILGAAQNMKVNIEVPPFPGFDGCTFSNERPNTSGEGLDNVVLKALSGMIHHYDVFMQLIFSGECVVHVACGSSAEEYEMGAQTMKDIKVGLFSNSVIRCRIAYPADFFLEILSSEAVKQGPIGQTRKKRDNKVVKVKSPPPSCPLLIPGQGPAKNARSSITKPQAIETWLESFKDPSSESTTVVSKLVQSSKENASCSFVEDKESPPKIETVIPQDQVATSSIEVVDNNNYSNDLISQIKKSAYELEKKHPAKQLRSKNNCLQGGASIDACNVVSVLDSVSMLDALSLLRPDPTKRRKNYLHLNLSPKRCEDLKMLCCQTIKGIGNVWSKLVNDDVHCLAFFSLWLRDPKCESSVRYLQIDSILFYRYSTSMEGQVGEVKPVLNYSRYPKACLVDRLLLIARLLSRNESAIDALYPDSVDLSLGRYFTSETTVALDYQRTAVPINTNGVKTLVDSLVKNQQKDDAWLHLTKALMTKKFKQDDLRSLTRFPMSFITHNISRPQDNMILGTLCELYQMTSIEVWQLEGDGKILCCLHCSCCGKKIGPESYLSELLRNTPSHLLKHHGINQESVTSVIQRALNRPIHNDDDTEVDPCRFGNGDLNSVKEASDIERDVKKRLSFADAAVCDTNNDPRLLENSVNFIGQLHSDVPTAMDGLNSYGEDIPSNMVHAEKTAKFIQQMLEKLVLSVLDKLKKYDGLDTSKAILSLVSKDWKRLETETTNDNHGSADNGSSNTEINHVTSQRPFKFQMDGTNLMKEGSMPQHESWNDDDDDPSLQIIPAPNHTSSDVYFKTSVSKSSRNALNTKQQCLEHLVTMLYASQIYRTGKVTKSKQNHPDILQQLLHKVGWERIGSDSVYIVKCNFEKRIGLPFLDQLKKIVNSQYTTKEERDDYFKKLATFFPSQEFLRCFPKNMLESIAQGKWIQIDKSDRERLAKPIMDAHYYQAVSVSLVQLCPQIYEVCLEKKMKNKISNETIYVTDKSIDIVGTLSEPWVCDGLRSLHSVQTRAKVVVAEGKRSGDSSTSTLQPTSRPRHLLRPNFWYDKDNNNHLCLAGSIVNCVAAMGHQTIAETLKNSICNTQLTDRDHNDPLDSELFKLLNENRIFYKEVFHHRHLEQLLPHLSSLGRLSSYPCVLFLSDTQSIGQTHVVVTWKGSVYDIESEFAYDLTMDNLCRGCGCDVEILSLKRMLILYQKDENSMTHLPRRSSLEVELDHVGLHRRNTSNRLSKQKRKTYRGRKRKR